MQLFCGMSWVGTGHLGLGPLLDHTPGIAHSLLSGKNVSLSEPTPFFTQCDRSFQGTFRTPSGHTVYPIIHKGISGRRGGDIKLGLPF